MIETITDKAKDLIKAINENATSGQIEEGRFCAVVPLEKIKQELEVLKEWANNGIWEKRQTD